MKAIPFNWGCISVEGIGQSHCQSPRKEMYFRKGWGLRMWTLERDGTFLLPGMGSKERHEVRGPHEDILRPVGSKSSYPPWPILSYSLSVISLPTKPSVRSCSTFCSGLNSEMGC